MKEVISSVFVIIGTYLGFCILYSLLLPFYFAVTLSGVTSFIIFFRKVDDIRLKIICITFIGYFVVYGINHLMFEINMNAKMKETFGIDAEKLNITKGIKMYTYEADRKKFSDRFIPFGQVATSPDEVGFLVIVRKTGYRQTGRYTTGTKIYTDSYNVRVVNLKTKEVIKSEEFEGRSLDQAHRVSTSKSTGIEHYLLEEVVGKNGRITNSILSCIPLLRFQGTMSNE